MVQSIKNWMGPYQRTPKKVTRAIKYPGLGVRSVGPVVQQYYSNHLKLNHSSIHFPGGCVSQSFWSATYQKSLLKNHGISRMVVWRSQNPAGLQSQTSLFCGRSNDSYGKTLLLPEGGISTILSTGCGCWLCWDRICKIRSNTNCCCKPTAPYTRWVSFT